jgi:hypothetical protein
MGVLTAASAIADAAPYPNWENLEKKAATEIKNKCSGATMEWFSARQTAADLRRIVGFVGDLGTGQRPKMCRLGTGARKGFYLAERSLQAAQPEV